jgi:hypothetical protein
MGKALVVPKLAATGEASPIHPFHKHSNKSDSRDRSSFIWEAAFETLSNIVLGVSPGIK